MKRSELKVGMVMYVDGARHWDSRSYSPENNAYKVVDLGGWENLNWHICSDSGTRIVELADGKRVTVASNTRQTKVKTAILMVHCDKDGNPTPKYTGGGAVLCVPVALSSIRGEYAEVMSAIAERKIAEAKRYEEKKAFRYAENQETVRLVKAFTSLGYECKANEDAWGNQVVFSNKTADVILRNLRGEA